MVGTTQHGHALRFQVYDMLEETARQLSSFDRRRQMLPFYQVMMPDRASRTDSGANIAILTVRTKEFTEALTVFEFVRQTIVDVPSDIEWRGRRFAPTYWMQPRGVEADHTWTIA